MTFQEIKKKFFELKEGRNFKVSNIQLWLSKYSNLYRKTYDSVFRKYLFTDYDGSTIRLPLCGKTTDEEIFLNLYESLNGILELHANEAYFEKEIVEYYKIKNSPSDIKSWIAKNEVIGAQDYVCFMIDYLDYDESDGEEHLKVYVPSLSDYEILIDRQDFKNTINFLEIFNAVYWVQKN